MVLVAIGLRYLQSPVDPIVVICPPLPKLEGPFAPNNRLNNIEFLWENEAIAPESLVFSSKVILTIHSSSDAIRMSFTWVSEMEEL